MKYISILMMKQTMSMGSDFFSGFNGYEEARGLQMISLLQRMVEVTNSTHDPESFLEYGCWCASNPNARKHDLTKGRSAPVDEIDNVCRSTAYCHMCLNIDHDGGCDFYQEYNHTLTTNGLECHDKEGTCGWAACKCDSNFVEEMALVQDQWTPTHNLRGGFDFGNRCLQPRSLTAPFDQCCGYKPDRFPFKSLDGQKSCCGDQIYDTTYLQCCEMRSDLNETFHSPTLQSTDCSIVAAAKNYADGYQIETL